MKVGTNMITLSVLNFSYQYSNIQYRILKKKNPWMSQIDIDLFNLPTKSNTWFYVWIAFEYT